MGTRARVNVYDGNEILVSIYRQYDGYPSGLGQEVADFVSKLKIVNGYSDKDAAEANGMGCLAAQLIKHLKEHVGNVYIRTPDGARCKASLLRLAKIPQFTHLREGSNV